MTEPVDTVLPTGKWEFDREVTAVFDNMLSRSIPDYDRMRVLTTDIAVQYAARHPDGSWIVDLGCSRGGALLPIIRKRGALNHYLGVEVSEPMREAAQQTLAPWIDMGIAAVSGLDLREGYPEMTAAVTLAVLTLQFTPIEYRQRIVADAYAHTAPGGALLLVEKILGDDHHLDSLFVDTYYDMKGEHGYTQEQIQSKRRSLEGVLVPVTAAWNVDLLRRAGFTHVDCYWRTLNFAAWVAVRD